MNANAVAEFTTIYPGWYSGRAVHVHFKLLYNSLSAAEKTALTMQAPADGSGSAGVITLGVQVG